MVLNKYDSSVEHAIILGDAIESLANLPDSCADACITDPPYNISGYEFKKEIGWLKSNQHWTKDKKFTKIDEAWDSFSNHQYEKFTKAWLELVCKKVKQNGNILVFGSYHNVFKIGYILQELDRRIVNTIVWYKPNAFPNITQRMFCESTEYILWAVNNTQKDAKNWIFNYEEMKKINSLKECTECNRMLEPDFSFCPYCGSKKLLRVHKQMRNMWKIPSTCSSEKEFGKHPSQKPVEVIKRLLLATTKKGDVVLDPFMGSGTVPVVAKMFERKSIGIDNNPKYCQLAEKRLGAVSEKITKYFDDAPL